ncbi:platelet-derived growth factor receptor beta isoform X3 [Folsomia candida]|uniref:platelet-derived growth factor receptor beta isoform X3 n=1 Tax=Folsomia candida TaxID=158441 RepID=UPI000B8F3F86|nr:platelet-derived growth factor receptor beta isoform X3 [Folsomia candida]
MLMTRTQQCGTAFNHLHQDDRRRIILVLVMFLNFAASEALEPPDIVNPGPTTTVHVGSDLILICHGDAPLHWIAPRAIDDRFTFDHKSNVNSSSVSRPYASTLTLSPASAQDVGVYDCVYNSSSEESSIYVFVDAPDNATSYTLRTPLISATDEGVVQLGSNFTVECRTVEESYVFYNINWTEPAHVINSGRATVSLDPVKEPNSSGNRKAFKATLTVVNAQREDRGTYICAVWTSSSRRSASKYVNVYGSEERFLNVTTDKTDIEERGGFDAKWVINISSYPTALDFTWRKVNSGEIGRDPDDPKYQIDRKGPLVVLKILNASLKDSGAYQFLVRLRDFSDVFKTLELRLTVLDKPEIFIKPKEPEAYFEQGKSYTLTCSGRGNPLPSISWWFMEIQTFQELERRPVTNGCVNTKGMEMIKPINTTTTPTSTLSPMWARTFASATISFRPTKHGVLVCKGSNDEGVGCLQRAVKVIDFPGDNGNRGFGVSAPEEFIDEDQVQLSCALSKTNGWKELTWQLKDRSGTLKDFVVDNSSVRVGSLETKWSWQKILTFPKISKGQNGEYVCILGTTGENETVLVNVQDMIPPNIHSTNLNQSEVTFKEGEPPELRLYCRANGRPRPTIEWTKDGLSPSQWPEEIKYTVSEDGENLTFSYIRSIASGKYACTARNRNGTANAYMDIEVEGNGIHPALIGLIVVFMAIILILMFCIIKKNHNKAKMKRFLYEIQKKEFEDGAVENINPELGIEDQANLLPYDNIWEFPRDRLRLGMQLGSGAFGRVMKAEAIGIIKNESATTVAVKMIKTNADESHIKALMSELKIMVHLGRHVNVVNLLGAVTTNLVKKKELFVIVEFCKYGSLLNYMHRHKHTFINQLDPLRGVIDSSIYRQMSRGSAQSEAPRLNYASLTFTDTGNSRTASNGYRTLEEIPVGISGSPVTPCGVGGGGFEGGLTTDGRRSADYQMESMCTDMSYISSSHNTGGGGGQRRSSCASSTWGDEGQGHYRGDYQHVEVRPIRSVDLLGWAFQMARGMEYLASRKVLHGDLAARNALLTEGNVVKICDFGLAKEMYKDYKYKKKSEGVLLPVKWMAIESIYYGVFSTQSDVWSFGVVLWELFTLGKTPYPGMDTDDGFFKKLNEGYRMEKPALAPSSIYDIMTECWAHESSARPTFSTLVDRIGDLMEEGHRQQYVDLNVPYDRMNKEWLSGKEDYLSRMSGPDFISASARPTPEREYENVSKVLEDSGYLIPNAVSPLSPNPPQTPPTQYQNILHSPTPLPTTPSEPTGQFLANNAGYVFMSRPVSEGTLPYVKVGSVEHELTTPTATNVGYVAIGLGGGDRISQENNKSHGGGSSSSDEDNNQQQHSSSPNNGGGGISNINYVPNNMFPPPAPLEHVVEEDAGSGGGDPLPLSPTRKTDNNALLTTKPHPNGSRRHLRRQKNDSGLGSIDSNQFESTVRGGDEDEEVLDIMEGGGVIPSQHNLTYVSHSIPNFATGNGTHSHTNGGIVLNGNGVIV